MDIKKISIIAPMCNEEETAKIYMNQMTAVMESLKNFKYEIIAVDDGSTDNTFNELLALREKYTKLGIVKLSRNYGLEGAINAGLNVASGDAIITMDADLQDPPEVALELIKMWEEGYQVVNGKRTSRVHDSPMKRITANLYYSFVKKLSSDVKLEENVANYRLLSKKVVDTIKSFPEVNRVFRVIVPSAGYKTATIEYSRDKRYAGTTKYSYRKLVKYALDGITSAGIKPLKYIMLIGIIQMAAFFVLLMVSIIMFFLQSTPWWIVLLASIIMFFMSLQLIALGIIGEYVGETFIEVKHRPISIIDNFISPKD